MKQKLAIAAILMIITGFGMIHGTRSSMEVISILMIGMGTAYLLFLLLSSKKDKSQSEDKNTKSEDE